MPLNRYKERRMLQGNHFEIFNESPGVWTLLIHEAFPEDAGYYLAKATNAAGTALTEAKLVVEGKGKTKRTPIHSFLSEPLKIKL